MKLDRTYKKRSDDQTNTMQNIILHYVREYNNAETVAELEKIDDESTAVFQAVRDLGLLTLSEKVEINKEFLKLYDMKKETF